MRLICCRNKLTPTDYQHNIIVLTRSILLFGLAILMLISVAAKDTLPSDGVVAPLSLNMGANKSGNIFNRDAPPLPTMVGCFLLVHSSWVAVPCLSPEEAAKLPPLMEGGNYGVKGVSSSTISGSKVLVEGDIDIQFSQFSGESDSIYGASDWSVQDNTNQFSGANGDTYAVQFAEQNCGSQNCGASGSANASLCIWQVDVTTQNYSDRLCVGTNIQTLSSNYHVSVSGYLSQSGGVYYLDSQFCDPIFNCWGVVNTDNKGLIGNWFGASGTILGYGGGSTADFTSPTSLSTKVFVDAYSPFYAQSTNVVETAEMNNLNAGTPSLSCGGPIDNPPIYYCRTTTPSTN